MAFIEKVLDRAIDTRRTGASPMLPNLWKASGTDRVPPPTIEQSKLKRPEDIVPFLEDEEGVCCSLSSLSRRGGLELVGMHIAYFCLCGLACESQVAKRILIKSVDAYVAL